MNRSPRFNPLRRVLLITSVIGLAQSPAFAKDEAPLPETSNEISCLINAARTGLTCLWIDANGKRSMQANDIQTFVDQAAVSAYITVRSRKGFERTFQPDPKSPPFRKLAEMKKKTAMAELSHAKIDLFAELEKKVIQLSESLDAQAGQADLVKFDASITGDKLKRQLRDANKELESLRASKEKLCTTTPGYEAMSRTNQNLQTVLSNLLLAFQQPGTCMENIKIMKDPDGTVDLRQLGGLAKTFGEQCPMPKKEKEKAK